MGRHQSVRRLWLSFTALLLSAFVLSSSQCTFAQIKLEEAFPNLEFTQPVDFQQSAGDPSRAYVVSQTGLIYVFQNSPAASQSKVFLDIRDRVASGGELGLLGLAFHPDYQTNGFFYVNYTRQNPLRTVISRFSVTANKDSADVLSEAVLMQFNQPYSNHNGGQLAFGPDGCLYIATGDGGSGGDPQNNAQNKNSLLGKILRINVNAVQSGLNYAVPEDNPFVGTDGRDEIYAYGLRNPWRFSFDPATGTLWAADVGQGRWEEVDIIQKGKNYGWRIMEGKHCYNPSSGCDTSGLVLPVWEYGHNATGGSSVTGGYLYRGTKIPALFGKYIYGDFISGRIWALEYNGTDLPDNQLLLETGKAISSFGADHEGEIYICSYSEGKLYKLVDSSSSSGIDPDIPPAPKTFHLNQNYPNPFNPATTIPLTLGTSAFVILKVYDMLGRYISTLLQERKERGLHEVQFDASSLSSGIYFYRVEAGAFSETKKMTVVK